MDSLPLSFLHRPILQSKTEHLSEAQETNSFHIQVFPCFPTFFLLYQLFTGVECASMLNTNKYGEILQLICVPVNV